jgi:hypothetical protein
VRVVCLDAVLRRHGAVDEAPECVARNADNALVFSDADTELDGLPVGIPPSVLGEAEDHGAPFRCYRYNRAMFLYCSLG